MTLAALALVSACERGGKASLPPAPPPVPAAAAEKPVDTAATSAPAVATAVGSAGETESTAVDGPESTTPPETGQAAQLNQPAAAGDGGGFRLTGQVSAPQKSAVAFRVGGFIEAIKALPGTKVKRGDPLATLDARDFQLRVDLARARKEQARVAAESARREFEREVELKKDNASTASVFEKIQAALDQARLAQKLAELDLQQAELALKDTNLLAPYDCVVAVQMKHVGENVQSGNPVLEVYDTGEPEISLDAPERLLGELRVGTRLAVTVPSAGLSADAEIIRLVPVIVERTRTFAVTARLAALNAKVVPGAYAEALVK